MSRTKPSSGRASGPRTRTALVLLFGLTFVNAARICAQSTQPVDADASPEARRLLAYLRSVYGKTTLTGMFSQVNSRVVQTVTGNLPAICALDASGWNRPIWGNSYRQVVQIAMDEAREWAKARGGILSLQYHWPRPGHPQGSAWVHENKDLGPFDLGKAVSPGTPENRAVLEDLRRTADYLEQLQKAQRARALAAAP